LTLAGKEPKSGTVIVFGQGHGKDNRNSKNIHHRGFRGCMAVIVEDYGDGT